MRETMVELITIVEGFFACGVAASRLWPARPGPASLMPDPVFANIGKLLLATQIYDMHRLAHYGLRRPDRRAARPRRGPQPGDGRLAVRRAGRAARTFPPTSASRSPRFIEDLTASHQGGWYSVDQPARRRIAGSDEAGDLAQLPGVEKVELVERLLDRGVLADGRRVSKQPGRCCETGCGPEASTDQTPEAGKWNVPEPATAISTQPPNAPAATPPKPAE